jgi:hypothetical protein
VQEIVLRILHRFVREIARIDRLHVRFCVRIAIRFGVRFPAKVVTLVNFYLIFSETFWQASVIGVRIIIQTLNPLYANRARNRSAICTQNRTCRLPLKQQQPSLNFPFLHSSSSVSVTASSSSRDPDKPVMTALGFLGKLPGGKLAAGSAKAADRQTEWEMIRTAFWGRLHVYESGHNLLPQGLGF